MKWYSFVFLYNVCVVKCHSIAISEIEDFSNFIKETSQLDQNVKSSFTPDYDDEESISDDAWEESGKFEGDLILNDRQRRLIVANVAEGLARNGLTDTTKRWPNNEVVYFIQTEHFTGDQVEAIQNGIADLARASCVKFTPYKKGDRDAVVIQGSRRGCFSQVGYQGGYQVLNLSGRHPVGRGCFRHGTVVHELLHTLGFYHMQSSHDRDDFIDIVWENIIRPARHNFRKYNSFSVSDFGVGYDYESVLHYSRKAFSSNGQDTIVPKMSGSNIGQRVGLSDKDVQKLNKMYCDADSDVLDESTVTKKPGPNKKAKNRPFEGQGIGYQGGKTVIIKHPRNQQDEVAHSPQIMYYFRSAPKSVQAPASAQGFEAGKEIKYNHPSTSSILKDNVVFGYKPNVQKNPQSKHTVLNTHVFEGDDATDNDGGLNEALNRFENIVAKSRENPALHIFDYDYSHYTKPIAITEKPNKLDVETLRYTHSETDEKEPNSHLAQDDGPSHTTEAKPMHFYSGSEYTNSKELIDQQNYGYVPSNGFGLQKHNYSDASDPEQHSDSKNISQMKSLVHIVGSYDEENVKLEPNDYKPYLFESGNLQNHPSIRNAHITDKKPFGQQYSYSVPVSHMWREDKIPTHDYYKNKYPVSAEVYR